MNKLSKASENKNYLYLSILSHLSLQIFPFLKFCSFIFSWTRFYHELETQKSNTFKAQKFPLSCCRVPLLQNLYALKKNQYLDLKHLVNCDTYLKFQRHLLIPTNQTSVPHVIKIDAFAQLINIIVRWHFHVRARSFLSM